MLNNRINRQFLQINDENNRQLKQLRQLITYINETNIINLLKNNNIGNLYLDEGLRCHTVRTDHDIKDNIYHKLTNKIAIKLKKYIDIGITNKHIYLEFIECIKKNGVLHKFCINICHYLSHNETETYDNIILQIDPKIKKQHKKYNEIIVSIPKNKTGYIYLIRTRASVNIDENVYKLGKTSKKFSIRMNGYDKGYETVFVHPIILENLDNLELLLLNKLEQLFIKRIDYGNEYFEGNYLEMCNIIIRNIIK